jgi:hypothetical protein
MDLTFKYYLHDLGLQRVKIIMIITLKREPGSSVCIVSDYGLDDRAIEVRSPAEEIGFFLCVQTGSGVHPTSCTMGTGILSRGLRCGRGVTLTTRSSSSAEVENE